MDFHLLAQSVIYFCIFVAGFIVAVPIGVNRWNFQGDCVLFAHIEWVTEHRLTMHSSSSVNCNFPLYYSMIGMIVYGLVKGLFYGYATYKSIRNPLTGQQMWVFPYIFLNAIHASVTLIVSCMLSVGFLQFCNGITKKDWVTSCSYFQNEQWLDFTTGDKFNAGPYTTLLTAAQVASWTCLLLFLLQTALCILRVVRNRRNMSKGSDVFNTGVNTDTKRIAELEPTA